MSNVLASPHVASQELATGWMRWLPIGLGLLSLYLPTFFGLARGTWSRDEYMHGPIVLTVLVWLVWQKRTLLLTAQERPWDVLGSACLLFGLLMYIVGRSQDIIMFEIGSLLPVLTGVLWVLCGPATLWRLAFPLFFILFMLPLPGFLVDALTGPLKQHVSAIAESSLYALGYPIARSGVVLSVGPYQLLVADACSGLHSLISMSAMGLLYVYLTDYHSMTRNVILAALLLPIAFAANVVRVIVLAVVTYHFGEAAGQGFIHGVSGIFLFIVGLFLLFSIDGLLGRVRPFRSRSAEARG